MAGKLYICATPIGNLDDITIRVLNTLKEVDLIACEDTRHTLKLLNHYGIKKPLISYHEHNKASRREILSQKLKEGQSIALVSDAGVPLISDPGDDILQYCASEDIEVTSLPGSCALITALTLSALDTKKFVFEGFLSVNKNQRNAELNDIKNEPRTLVFYEAPHKLLRTLKDFYQVLGNRKISLCRELTKKYEEIKRTTIKEAIDYYEQNNPKGEFVLVVDGYCDDGECFFADMTVDEHVAYYEKKGYDNKQAIKLAAKDRGVSKRDVYNIIVKNTVD